MFGKRLMNRLRFDTKAHVQFLCQQRTTIIMAMHLVDARTRNKRTRARLPSGAFQFGKLANAILLNMHKK